MINNIKLPKINLKQFNWIALFILLLIIVGLVNGVVSIIKWFGQILNL